MKTLRLKTKTYPISSQGWDCKDCDWKQFKRIEALPGVKTVFGFSDKDNNGIIQLAWAQSSANVEDNFNACAFGLVINTGFKTLAEAEKECLRLLLFSMSGIIKSVLQEQTDEMFKNFKALNGL